MTIGEVRHACDAYNVSDDVPATPINSKDEDAAIEDDFESDLVRNANEIIGPVVPSAAVGDYDSDDSRPCKYRYSYSKSPVF